jgi:Tol biopolymer transport system component/DNA-binding winged helix-turn-helix (wHTH) protein
VPLHAPAAEKTCFGQFELTTQTAELFKNGRKVRLSGQSAQLLVFLVQRAGQLVSREDLRRTLWPQGTYVDFDRGLNNCISRIRETLGDSSAIPQFIETLPKQGYRFIAETRASGLVSTLREKAIPERHTEPVLAPAVTAPSAREPSVRRPWGYIVLACSLLLASMGAVWQLWERDYFWHNPLDGARVERLTDFEGDELDAAVSADGKFAIFSSDRSGQPDVWLTQIGSGEFANITKGSITRFIFNNATVRRTGFSGDDSEVWVVESLHERPTRERTWMGPTIGGVFRPFLEEGLEPAWSPDGSRMVYRTPDAGDPIFIADPNGSNPKRIFAEKPGVHCHYLTWSPDGRYVYFVSGTPSTEEMDIWRIPVTNSDQAVIPERMTHHNARVAYISWLDSRTIVYSATAEDGSGLWLYSMDVEHRIPHRVSFGIGDQYLSVSISTARPHRIVASVARPTANLWTIPLSEGIQPETSASRLSVPNVRALGPRYGADYLLFLSGHGSGDGLWRLDGQSSRELWKGSDRGLVAPPAIAPGSGRICFSYRKAGRARLNIMDSDGTNLRTVAPSLDVRGGVSWSPDGKWMAVAADRGHGTHLFKIPADGGEPVQLLDSLSYNPVWSPDGKTIVYSEQQGGGQFAVKAVTPEGSPVLIPAISVVYTRGTSYRFLPGENALIALEGDFRNQDFFRVDLSTGEHRKLTDLQPGYRVQDFDVSLDGKQIVFDRVRDNADVVVMDLIK